MLVAALGARPVNLRCSDLAEDQQLPELAGADTVIHAAGPRVHSGLKWVDYLREHVGTTSRVARSMMAGGHLVLVSSAAVYGSRRGQLAAIAACEPATFPVPAYAWAKLAAELVARAICAERQISLTILRPSIIYGPGAGGVLIKLRDLARRGVRLVLEPAGTRHHLLHLDLFQRVLEAVVASSPPREPTTYVVADPFVVTTADLNIAFSASGRHAVPIPVRLTAITHVLREWQRRSERSPGPLAIAAMLELDNVYDWRPCLSDLKIDPAEFGREGFDAFLRHERS